MNPCNIYFKIFEKFSLENLRNLCVYISRSAVSHLEQELVLKTKYFFIATKESKRLISNHECLHGVLADY